MQGPLRVAALILVALAVSASSSPALADSLMLKAGSKLWLDGKSTIHEFKSTASSLQATFQQNDSVWPADATGAAAVQRFIRAKGVTSMEVVVQVNGLHSGKDGLDKNMYKALLATKHPEIRFRMASYELGGAGQDTMAIDAQGSLTIAGVERDVRIPVTAVREGEAVRMRGSVPLLMSQFGIKPPVMMMGTLRTADRVVVSFDLLVGTAEVPTGATSGE